MKHYEKRQEALKKAETTKKGVTFRGDSQMRVDAKPFYAKHKSQLSKEVRGELDEMASEEGNGGHFSELKRQYERATKVSKEQEYQQEDIAEED